MASRRGERGRNYVTAGTPTLVVRLLVFAIVTAFRAFAFMSRLQRLETHRTTGTGRLDVHCQKKKIHSNFDATDWKFLARKLVHQIQCTMVTKNRLAFRVKLIQTIGIKLICTITIKVNY